jgi:hypothetical protein
MKKSAILSLSFLATLLVFVCCKKDQVTPSSTGTVTFTVDSLTKFQSSAVGGVWESTNSLMNITAKGGKSIIVMNVIMPSGLKAGTYNFTATSAAGMAIFYRPDTTVITEGYYSNIDTKSFGTLIITSVTADSLVTGTFTYTLKDPVSAKIKKITTGVLTQVKVKDNRAITTGTTTNSFTAKVDGVVFKPTQITGVSAFGKISLVASDGTKSIGLNIIQTAKAGTYTMDFLGDYSAQYIPSMSISNPVSYVGVPATSKLIITEHTTTTKVIKGTFNFIGEEFLGGTKKYTITEGVFSVKY